MFFSLHRIIHYYPPLFAIFPQLTFIIISRIDDRKQGDGDITSVLVSFDVGTTDYSSDCVSLNILDTLFCVESIFSPTKWIIRRFKFANYFLYKITLTVIFFL